MAFGFPSYVLYNVLCCVCVGGHLGGHWALLSSEVSSPWAAQGFSLHLGPNLSPTHSSSALLSLSLSHLPLGSSSLAVLTQRLSHMTLLQSLR